MLLFLGIGLGAAALVVINAVPSEDAEFGGVLGVAGAIVGFLGLGYLVYYFIARRIPGDASGTPSNVEP